jgi:large subunit ribosomal protein L4
MPVLDVKNLEGVTVGQIELADDVFGARVNSHLLHETVRHYLAAERAGTHKTKDKSEVSGSGRKLWKQKGTGRARVGSIRSPLWRHGGTVHGPVPRSYAYALPKKMIVGALRSALSEKLAQQKLTVVEGWVLESHKTKAFRQSLGKLESETRTILLVENGANVNLERASRNLDGVTLVPSTKLEPYDLLRHDHLMLSREAAMRLSRALSAEKSGESPVHPQPAQVSPLQGTSTEPSAEKPAPAKASARPDAAPKAAKKPAARKPEKAAANRKDQPKVKPKAKKE